MDVFAENDMENENGDKIEDENKTENQEVKYMKNNKD